MDKEFWLIVVPAIVIFALIGLIFCTMMEAWRRDTYLRIQYKVQRDELLTAMRTAQVGSGVCCCGDDMKNHDSAYNCGHTPVDIWDNLVMAYTRDIQKFDAEQEKKNAA